MATSVTSASAASMKRLTGLVSGLDTDSLVKQMVLGHQTKLNKANQQKQLIDWQKGAYRSVISRVTEFQNKFLDVLNPNSVLRTSAFKAATASVSEAASKYVSVSAATEYMPSSLTINQITQLATSQTVESISTFSGSLEMVFDESNVTKVLGQSLAVTLDGVTKNIKIASDIAEYYTLDETIGLTLFDAEKVAEDLNKQLKAAFGIKADGTAKVQFAMTEVEDSSGVATGKFKLELNIPNGSDIKLSGAAISKEFGFKNDWTNYLNTDKTLTELFKSSGLKAESAMLKFSINSIKFEVSQTATLRDVMNNINASTAGVKMTYSSITDKITFTSVETGSGNNIVLEDLDGTNFLGTMLGREFETDDDGEVIVDGDGNNKLKGLGKVTGGNDARAVINGTEIIRNSNTFTVDGIKIQLLDVTVTETFDFGSIAVTGGIDSTQAVTNIKDFVDSYNGLMEFLNGVIREDKQKGYLPLTDEQRAEMSDKDIENWEKAAKQGILRGDSTISKMISEMRSAMISMVTAKIGGGKISLTSIGISTSSISTSMSNGFLTVDETKLRAAIEKDPEAVSRLFTQTSDIPKGQTLTSAYTAQGYKTQTELNNARFNTLGIAQRISEIVTLNVNLSTSTVGQGKLIKIAGTDGSNKLIDNESTLGKQLTGITKTITQLQVKLYEAEDNAYLKMSRLETALSKLNSQSSYLFNSQ